MGAEGEERNLYAMPTACAEVSPWPAHTYFYIPFRCFDATAVDGAYGGPICPCCTNLCTTPGKFILFDATPMLIRG